MTALEHRREVMKHAKSIGHCVCDRTKTCPCDDLKATGICRCAGEQEEEGAPSIHPCAPRPEEDTVTKEHPDV